MPRRRTTVLSLLASTVMGGLSLALTGGLALRPADAAVVTLPAVQARQADSLVDATGVNVHLEYYSTAYKDYPAVKSALLDLGIRHVRDHMLADDNTFFAQAADLAAAGVRFDMIMGGWPGESPGPEALVSAVATKLPTGVVESLEGVNEWDISGLPTWPTELRAHQTKLHTAAEAEPATRDLPLVAPALSRWQSYGTLGDLTGLADVQNAHLYPGGLQPSYLVKDYLALADDFLPGKPVTVTEAGYHNATATTSTHYPTSEAAAAAYLPKLLLEHYRAGSQRVYLYELVDERDEPGLADKEQHFGLLRNDFTPKPGYTAVKRLLTLVKDPGPAFAPATLRYRADGPADLRQVLVQKRNGAFVLLLWRDVSVWDRISKSLLPVSPSTAKVTFAAKRRISVARPSSSAATKSTTATSISVPLDGGVVALTITRP